MTITGVVYNGLSTSKRYVTITFETKAKDHYINISLNEILDRQDQIKEAIELARNSARAELKILETMNDDIGLVWSHSCFQLVLLGTDSGVKISRQLNGKMIVLLQQLKDVPSKNRLLGTAECKMRKAKSDESDDE